jgi:photosystem II stability/assembly factor-like uncharacterized protein
MNRGLHSHGPVLAVLFDRSTPGRLLAGLNAGRSLFSSDDDGETWQALAADPSPARGPWPPPTYALLQPAGFPHVILAATGGGLYRSSDVGRHWQPVQSEPASGPVYALAADQSGAVYLGGEGPVVLRSTSGGLDWKALSPLPAGEAVLALAASPSGDWLLAGTNGSGLYSSRDQGATWQRIDEVGSTFVSAIVLQAAGRPPCSPGGDCVLARARSGLFTSLDGGDTWRKVNGNWGGRLDAVTVAGAEPAWILATDRGRLYRSTDGERWEPWGDGFGRNGAAFCLASDPDRPEHLVAGSENGLYRSSDGGLHWRQPIDGPGAPSADALAMGPGGLLYLGNLDGVYSPADGGATWERRSQGLPPVPILALAVAPSAPNVVYAGTNGAGLFRSDDGGLNWSVTGWTAPSVPGIVVHPADPNRVYFRVAFERVYSSEDGGQSVQSRWNGFTTFTEIMSLVIDEREPDRLYAGSTDALYRSLDGAGSWLPIGPELDGQTVFALLADDTGQGRLLAGATKGAFVSADEGVSWSRLGHGLEDITVTALAIHPLKRERVYAGTRYKGVYRSGNGGQTWLPAGMGDMSVNALFVSEDGRWLYAATPQGFFRAEAR